MTSLGFLTYTLNDLPAALPNLERLRPYVDESVVIDSSTPDHVERFRPDVERLGGRIVRVVPLCSSDLLRPFAITEVRSDRVVEIDTDEEPTPALLDRLGRLGDADAYVVPRYEAQLDMYTSQLRVYRPSALRFEGPSYGFPHVAGAVGSFARREHLVHRADYTRYLHERGRWERNFLQDSLQRPYTRTFFEDAMSLRLGGSVLRPPGVRWIAEPADAPLGPAALEAALLVRYLFDATIRGGRSWARFQYRYDRAKQVYLRSLTDDERALRRGAAEEIRRAGGLIRYLELDDASRLRQLTAGFNWNRTGPELLRRLVIDRYHDDAMGIARGTLRK
jgi:hypothetical protein